PFLRNLIEKSIDEGPQFLRVLLSGAVPAHRYRAVFHLATADDQHVRHFGYFRSTDFVADFLVAEVCLGSYPGFSKLPHDVLRVRFEILPDRQDLYLNRREPCREVAAAVFDQYADEPLE